MRVHPFRNGPVRAEAVPIPIVRPWSLLQLAESQPLRRPIKASQEQADWPSEFGTRFAERRRQMKEERKGGEQKRAREARMHLDLVPDVLVVRM